MTLMTDLTPPNRGREIRLVEEYHALCNQEDGGTLSSAQAARLRQVEAELDFLEDQDPTEQEADRRLQETGDKLDEVLTLLRSLPRKDAAACSEPALKGRSINRVKPLRG